MSFNDLSVLNNYDEHARNLIKQHLDIFEFPFHYSKQNDNSWLEDFGDSTQRLGMLRIWDSIVNPTKSFFTYSFEYQLRLMLKFNNETRQYEPVRHWDDEDLWGQFGIMSRDNLISMIAAYCFQKDKSETMDILFWTLFSRLGRLWNVKNISGKTKPSYQVDWLGPISWSFLLRTRKNFLLYPLIFILDFFMIFQAIIQVGKSLRETPDNMDTTDDVTFQPLLVTGLKNQWTLGVCFANLIYRFRKGQPISSYFRKRKTKVPIPMHLVWDKVFPVAKSWRTLWL